MPLIQIYLDKSDDSSNKYIELLKSKDIDFLQTNLENEPNILKSHKLSSLPAMKFQNSLVYDITEKSINKIVKKFNQYVYNLADLNANRANLRNFKNSLGTTDSQKTKLKNINATKIKIENNEKFSKLFKVFLNSKK